MDDLVGIEKQSDIDRVLVIYDDLIRGTDTNDAIVVLDDLANQGNLFAAYVLGSCYIFGMPPRHYDFNRIYTEQQLAKTALIPKDERKAFGYYFQLLNFENEIEQYQLEGVYDFYRILKGTAPIFKHLELELRPKPGDEPNDFTVLFENADEVLSMLKEFDYYESYIDIAKYNMQLFKSSDNKEYLDTAILYLNKILKPKGRIFSQADELQATLQFIDIYLYGNTYIPADTAMAKSLAIKSNSDQALLIILNYLEDNNVNDPTDLEPILTRIMDNGIRFEQRNRFNLPYAIKPTDRLAKMWTLFGVKTPIMSDIYQSTASTENVPEPQDLKGDVGSTEPDHEASNDGYSNNDNQDEQFNPEEIAESAEQAQDTIRMLLLLEKEPDREDIPSDDEYDDQDDQDDQHDFHEDDLNDEDDLNVFHD